MKLEKGVSLVELLISLVISLLLASAVYALYISTSEQAARTRHISNMFQSAQAAMQVMTGMIQQSAYGLNTANCFTYNMPAGGGITTAYTFSVAGTGGASQSLNLAYAPSGITLPAVGTFGQLTNSSLIPDQNGMILASAPPACAISQLNAGVVQTGQINSLLTAQGVSSGNISNAALYYLGSSSAGTFLNYTFQILNEPIPGGSPVSVPSLVLSASNPFQPGAAVTQQVLASNVVDLQMLCGYFTGNNQTTYGTCAGNPDTLRAVQIYLLARSGPFRSYNAPASIQIVPAIGGNPAVTYVIPMGFTNYRYQLLQTTLLLKNYLWAAS